MGRSRLNPTEFSIEFPSRYPILNSEVLSGRLPRPARARSSMLKATEVFSKALLHSAGADLLNRAISKDRTATPHPPNDVDKIPTVVYHQDNSGN